MALIELDDVCLSFTMRQSKKVTLKEYLLKGLFLNSLNPAMQIHAISHLNLKVEQGERIGIIGHNGAGKTTTLKMLAGVYPPSSGRRVVNGRICSLFDINVGFENEATGWDNIYYRGYLQGETPRTLKPKVEAIAEFTELGDYLNMPVRYYSAGMMVRLAFAIATAVEPEILLVDEMLSAGDLAFQQKASARIKEMINTSKVVVLVSHDLESVKKLCTRVLWFEHGSVRMEGDPTTVVDSYVIDVWSKIPTPPTPPDVLCPQCAYNITKNEPAPSQKAA